MIKEIAKKEFLSNILSFRFLLAFISTFLLFSTGSLLFLKEYSLELKRYREISSRYQNKKSVKEIYIFPRPNQLNFCVEGGEKNFPDFFIIDSASFITSGSSWKKIFRLTSFENIDWAFLVSIFFSLISLIFSYDAFASEKEMGRMSLILSNPIKKLDLLYGKFLGILMGNAVIFIMGIIISLLIISVSPNVNFGLYEYVKIFTFVVLSFIYIIFFIIIGLLTSSLTYKSPLSLLFSLIFWLLFVIVLPILIPYFIPKNIPSQIKFELQEKLIEKARSRKFDQIADQEILADKILEAKNEEEADRIIEEYEKNLQDFNREGFNIRKQLKEEYQRKIESFFEKNVYLSFLSPVGLFNHVSEGLIGAGYSRYRNLKMNLREYSKIFSRYCEKKKKEKIKEAEPAAYMTFYIPDRANPGEQKLVRVNISYSFRNVKFDFSDFPVFMEREPNFVNRLKEAGIALSILITYMIFFFFLLMRTLKNYDPR